MLRRQRGNSYRAAGFSTRSFCLSSSLGAISGSKSTRSPSFGMWRPTFGCGQSVPHSTRLGAALTSAWANGIASRKGGPRRGDALRAANLDPTVLELEQIDQRWKRLLVETGTRFDAAHVVDHEWKR